MRVVFPFSVIFVSILTLFLLVRSEPSYQAVNLPPVASSTQPSATPVPSPIVASSTSTTTLVASTTPKNSVSKPKIKPALSSPSATSTPAQIERVEPPYLTSPTSLESIDATARAALVNILCMPKGGSLRPISGSGVIIDSRGVILTNAHVAQYVLLSESPQINLSCLIKSGSPATYRWQANVLYIPSIWINDHYSEINADHVVGTGEHDYALLLITGDSQGNPVNAPLPYVPIDTRANAAFQNDGVLGAGYPAELVGGIATQQGLYAVTSVSAIKQLLTFNTSTVDVYSIGGVIEAQGGSSGGPVINAWNYVVGIITTTSEGATTADRDLHALSANYMDRDIFTQSGHTFSDILKGNLKQMAEDFSRETAPNLIQKYIDYLSH